uniref:Uncharacterized protein n=1 Tax=Arundo donax TaxID=35708 RepID=A0A0A8XP46_ARUDO
MRLHSHFSTTAHSSLAFIHHQQYHTHHHHISYSAKHNQTLDQFL